MPEQNFIRFFLIFNEVKPSSINSPGGYCKVESLANDCTFTVSLRNLTSSGSPYRLYIALRSSDTPISADELTPGADGAVYKSINTEPQSIFQSNMNIKAIEAMYIMDCNGELVLSGYTNRNISESLRKINDEKLKNIYSEQKFEAATVQTESAETCDEDVYFDTPEDIGTNNESDSSDEPASAQEPENSANAGSLSSYVETLQRLYQGLTGSFSNTNESTEPEAQSSCSSYQNEITKHYNELFDKCEKIFPFDLFKNNSKWITQQSAPHCLSSITGLIYDKGNIIYIANGIPVYTYTFYVPQYAQNMVWMPAKENQSGIIGYWLSFVNAQTGNRASIADVMNYA